MLRTCTYAIQWCCLHAPMPCNDVAYVFLCHAMVLLKCTYAMQWCCLRVYSPCNDVAYVYLRDEMMLLVHAGPHSLVTCFHGRPHTSGKTASFAWGRCGSKRWGCKHLLLFWRPTFGGLFVWTQHTWEFLVIRSAQLGMLRCLSEYCTLSTCD